MPPITPTEPWPLPELQRARRAIVVVDVVESVRLMQEDESGFIDRWRRFVNEVRTEVLPAHGGRLVKSLGDGMLLEFGTALAAVQACLALREVSCAPSASIGLREALAVRVGAHLAEVVVDELDIYGSGVNLAARLAAVAGPGEIVVSAEVRDALLTGIDADFEDLGDCYLKHIEAPVRAFRVTAADQHPRTPSAARYSDLRPTIVALALRPLSASGHEAALGDIVIDDLIAALSVGDRWNVISRLSSHTMAARAASLPELRTLVGATYAISGSYRVVGSDVVLSVELADTRDGHVIWADRLRCGVGELFMGDSPLLQTIVGAVSRSVLSKELARANAMTLPTLEGYALLMHSVTLMHRTSIHESQRASDALHHLIDRYPRAPEPRAWLAKWFVMRVAQAWTANPKAEAVQARALLARALDMAPDHSLALAMDGLMHAFVDRDLDTAQTRYEQALAVNPNESHAWLLLSSVHAHLADGARACECIARARALSPIDPLGYFYDLFDAWALLAAGRHEEAERRALSSMRANCSHLPTFTVLTAAHALAGHAAQAHAVGQRLLEIRPEFSVDRFVTQFPGGASPYARRLGDALSAAGLPT